MNKPTNKNEVTVLTDAECDALAARVFAGVETVRKLSVATADNALAVSMRRVRAVQEYYAIAAHPAFQAMCLSAGRAFGHFEIADGVTDHGVIQGATEALLKGLLLSDEAGPHFTLIAARGKDRATVMIKETGFRHKFKTLGAKNLRVQVAALGMKPRATNANHTDMVLIGVASCEIGGQTYKTERTKEMPVLLPCYPNDTPDKTEAQARRRLLRDLWVLVSGEATDDDGGEERQPIVVSSDSLPRIAETEINPQALYDGTLADLQPYLLGLPEDGARETFAAVLDVIAEIGDPELLQGKIDSDIVPELRKLKVSRAIGEKVVRLANQRIAVLRADGR
jgi:hypothetical protein